MSRKGKFVLTLVTQSTSVPKKFLYFSNSMKIHISIHQFSETCSVQSNFFFFFEHTTLHQVVMSWENRLKNLENKSLNSRLMKMISWQKLEFETQPKMQFSETCSIQRLIFPSQWYNYVSRCIVMQKKFKKTQKLNFKCYGFENKILKKSSWNLPILRRRFDPFILLKDASNPARWLWN